MFLNYNPYLPNHQNYFSFAAYKQNIMSKTKLTINNNGSVKIEGDFEIVDKNGNAYGLQGREVLSICRCGLSQNKPFCDGAHKGHFEHEAIAFDLPPKKA
jgi:CDGSH-type Zn-finger protein